MKTTHKFILFLTLFTLFFCLLTASAQTLRKVSGTVLDSAKVAISDANILLIVGADTLKTVSDKEGNFSFKGTKAETFIIQVSIMGYKTYQSKYNFEKDSKQLTLNPIILTMTGTMLKEVKVQAKINPIRVMTDTIEYNAAAYQVLQGDKVSDLLKQLPGLEVDDDDNVTTLGKGMTKLRVNGKDFLPIM